jgi:hypothetical protein
MARSAESVASPTKTRKKFKNKKMYIVHNMDIAYICCLLFTLGILKKENSLGIFSRDYMSIHNHFDL